jgi:hypothetical protein
MADTSMRIARLSAFTAHGVARVLANATYEALIAYDPIDDAIKIKVDGGTWSPPLKDATGSR